MTTHLPLPRRSPMPTQDYMRFPPTDDFFLASNFQLQVWRRGENLRPSDRNCGARAGDSVEVRLWKISTERGCLPVANSRYGNVLRSVTCRLHLPRRGIHEGLPALIRTWHPNHSTAYPGGQGRMGSGGLTSVESIVGAEGVLFLGSGGSVG